MSPLLGVISDTHGRVVRELPRVFAGVERILHAGDVGSVDVLQELGMLAPVTAVRGNTDPGYLMGDLPLEATVEVGGVRILVGHVENVLLRSHDPPAEGIGVVVTGHTHRAKAEDRDGVLHLDPGAAGPRRFGLPRTVALLTLDGGRAQAEIVTLWM